MIDIDKIEKDARYDKYLDTVHVLHPTTVLEMVALIRKQREVMRQALDALTAMQAYAAAEKKGLLICDEAIKALEEVLK